MRVDRKALAARWDRLWQGRGSQAVREELFDRIFTAYTGADRHYHDIGHISDCLSELDQAKAKVNDARAVEAAIWFHDVVYDGRRKDNEQASAEASLAALPRVEAAKPFCDEVKELIMLTRHDRAPATDDGKLIVDIDLSSLALPQAEFDENSAKIRREYAHMDETEFNRGRLKLLGDFLGRPRIYYTQDFYDRYESRARENLQRTLTRLKEESAAQAQQ